MVLVVPVSTLCPLLALMCELGLHNKHEVGGVNNRYYLQFGRLRGQRSRRQIWLPMGPCYLT